METVDLIGVCKTLKITVQTGRNRISQGKDMPPSFKVGRKRLFILREVESWILARSVHSIS